MKVLVIIPAYNEEESILNTLKDLADHVPSYDLVVINDCSTDSTKALLRTNGFNFVDLPVNLGIGGGVQTGYRYALEHGYDIAIQFDGDGQHDARYLPDLVSAIQSGGCDIAIGSRFIKKEGFQSSAMRRLGINILSSLIRMLCGTRVYDVTSGMRAANQKMIAHFVREYAQDYPEPEAILSAAMAGAKIQEVPVEMRERQGGVSSINPMRSAYYMLKVSMALILSRMTLKRGELQ